MTLADDLLAHFATATPEATLPDGHLVRTEPTLAAALNREQGHPEDLDRWFLVTNDRKPFGQVVISSHEDGYRLDVMDSGDFQRRGNMTAAVKALRAAYPGLTLNRDMYVSPAGESFVRKLDRRDR